ncbi:BsuPI-related putative proteinase inhibitor [Salipaludibacillus aurantiacus]|uniref:Intracellular proteinase inhibitor n=1 Tax=Salipaludibacillus aurantiacus TaxID=1601833 RepID=A0A1H9TAJ0_9BACI|nr:BsuPI-related putative proteinase inhibitor [Salipaludibacillus aurantiacus]SER94057.1 Intracellular proteinase inhibitor [Salipaludibacillus aurantiacus]
MGRLKKAIIFIFLLVSFMLTACGQANNNASNENSSPGNEEGGAETVEKDGLTFTAETEEKNETLIIRLILENTSDDSKVVEFSSGHQFDIVIRDEEGTKFYNFAEGKMFTQAIIKEELSPGDSLTFEDEWNYSHLTFESLKIGAKLNIYQIDGQPMDEQPYQLVIPYENNQ